MNERSDFDRALRTWFEDGPSTMPDRVVDVVASRIGRQPQRRTWRLRRSPMSAQVKLIAAAAAVLVLAVVGYNLLPKGPSIGPSPSATASPLPTPAPTATAAATRVVTCDTGDTTCAGPLSAGANSSVEFRPALSFTVPAGWTNTFDVARAYTLHYNFTRSHFFQVMSQVAIPAQNATCSAEREAGAGNGVADWVEFLMAHPGLEVSTPEAVTVGGAAGMRLSLSVRASWTETCPASIGPAVMLVTDNGTIPSRTRWIDNQQTMWWIVDVSGETVILHLESSPSSKDLIALQAVFEPIIATFEFTPAG